MRDPMRQAPAFTLMEAVVAMAIAAIISMAALSLYSSITRSLASVRATSVLTTRAQDAAEYMTIELRGIGGNGLSPASAIFVEHGCATLGTSSTPLPACTTANDRMIALSAIAGLPVVPMMGMTFAAAPTVANKGARRGTVNFLVGGRCLLGDPASFNHHAILRTPAGLREFLYMSPTAACIADSTSAACGTDVAACTVQWENAALPAMAPYEIAGSLATDYDLAAAPNMTVVDFRTFFVDTGLNALLMHLDRDSNGYGLNPTTDGERMFLLDGVYSFRVALGYDLDKDGRLGDGAGIPEADEWAGNGATTSAATGDLAVDPTSGSTVATTSILDASFKMVQVEIVVGIASGSPSASSPLFVPAIGAGLSVSGIMMRGASTRVTPRNL